MMELESILVLDDKQAEFARLFPLPGVAVSLNTAKSPSKKSDHHIYAYETVLTKVEFAKELLAALESISECLAGKEKQLDSDIRIVTDVTWNNLVDEGIHIELIGKLSDPFVTVTVSEKSESIVSYRNEASSRQQARIAWPKLMANLSTLLTTLADVPLDPEDRERYASFAARSFLVKEVERRRQA